VAGFDEGAAAPDADFADRDPKVLREQAREATRAYLTELAPSVRAVAVERKLELGFAGAAWRFVCYLDVEDECGDVIDLKVSERHVTEAKAQRDQQASAYLFGRLTEGRPAPRFVFHSVRRGAIRTGSRCDAVPTERTGPQLSAFERRLAMTVRQIDRCATTGEWPYAAPDGWWCAAGMCPAFGVCPGGAATTGVSGSAPGDDLGRLAA
jgi:hypothetical protein